MSKLDLNANYLPKIEKRFAAQDLPEPAARCRVLFAKIQMRSPATRRRSVGTTRTSPCDPVFSNVLMTDEAHLPARHAGEGKSLTLQGDVLYDLSKIYQCPRLRLHPAGIPLQERDAEIQEPRPPRLCRALPRRILPRRHQTDCLTLLWHRRPRQPGPPPRLPADGHRADVLDSKHGLAMTCLAPSQSRVSKLGGAYPIWEPLG